MGPRFGCLESGNQSNNRQVEPYQKIDHLPYEDKADECAYAQNPSSPTDPRCTPERNTDESQRDEREKPGEQKHGVLADGPATGCAPALPQHTDHSPAQPPPSCHVCPANFLERPPPSDRPDKPPFRSCRICCMPSCSPTTPLVNQKALTGHLHQRHSECDEKKQTRYRK